MVFPISCNYCFSVQYHGLSVPIQWGWYGGRGSLSHLLQPSDLFHYFPVFLVPRLYVCHLPVLYVVCSGNYASAGGAVAIGLQASIQADSCTFRNNSAGSAGGIWFSQSTDSWLSRCVFLLNRARGSSPSVGGGLYLTGSEVNNGKLKQNVCC
jgi:hypothetical protein